MKKLLVLASLLMGSSAFATDICDGCNFLDGVADVNFTISAGGVESDLYVCELGFLPSACENGACGGDYIEFMDQKIVVGSPWTSGVNKTVKHGTAGVFLNSIKTGSKWYVKYCLDVERQTVGDETPETFQGNLTSSVFLSIGEDNNYLSVVQPSATVYFGTSINPLLPGTPLTGTPWSLFQTEEDLTSTEVDTTPLCANFGADSSHHYEWLVVYDEAAVTRPCLRTLIKDIDAITGAVTHSTTGAQDIFSQVSYKIEFDCEECGN